ncbi:hypothetical protein HPP92_028999 [Vanilla planifolia]|uniref:Uncharacterized protein n=1 Tax=Vanilla planifolia TaxID=51239 RepID=A0A835U2N7_VANPL|nr:hypothetical protein HPP92_028999 [Vanilla planifolia]KAG0446122.1 hypothetical protein HPP92_028988 [Vanilla planifolia]
MSYLSSCLRNEDSLTSFRRWCAPWLGSSGDLAVGPVSIASLIADSMLRRAVNRAGRLLHSVSPSPHTFSLVSCSLLSILVTDRQRPRWIWIHGGAAIYDLLQPAQGFLGIALHQSDHRPVMNSVFHETKVRVTRILLAVGVLSIPSVVGIFKGGNAKPGYGPSPFCCEPQCWMQNSHANIVIAVTMVQEACLVL